MDYKDIVTTRMKYAFEGFLPINELYKMGKIPESYRGIFKDRCECGSENIMKTNLKIMTCCNPSCRLKIAYSMEDMFKAYGCQDIGEETCKKITNYCIDKGLFKEPTHTEILGLTEDLSFLIGSRYYSLLNAIAVIKSKSLTFGDLISRLQIPGFGKECAVLFEDVNSIQDFYNMKDTGVINYLSSKGIQSPGKMVTFLYHMVTIYYAELNLQAPLLKKGYFNKEVCITRNVSVDNVSYTRKEFLDLCNSIGLVNGIQLFTVSESGAVKSVDHIIADSPTNTRKYRVGLERQSYGEKDVLITAQEYVNKLREEVQECKKILEERCQNSN